MAHSNDISIGLWGQFDTGDLEAHIRMRIAARELVRRVPNATIRIFAPFGPSTLPVTAGFAIEPLSPVTDQLREALAQSIALIVRVGEIDASRYLATRSESDINTMGELFDNPANTIPVARDPRAAHPALLTSRIWDKEFCSQRLEFLRAMHWWPATEPAIVLDASSASLEDGVAAQRERPNCALVSIHSQSDAPSPVAQTVPHHTIPASQSSVEDVVSAIANAALVITFDPTVLAIAASYGVPAHNRPIQSHSIAAEIADIDREFDETVQLIGRESQNVLVSEEVRALRAALVVHQRRLAHERAIFANYVRALRNNAAREVERARESRTLIDKISSRLLKRQ